MSEELEETLGLPLLLLISVSTIMGTGVFFLPALGAAHAGVTSLISWAIIAVISIYVGFCFAELAGRYPTSGGLYEYCKQAFGPFPAFMAGWATLIAGNITIAMLIVGAVRYLNPALPQAYKIGVSVFFILIFNYVAYRGMEVSGKMLAGFSIAALTALFGVLIPAVWRVEWSNFTPFFTHGTRDVLVTTFLIAETFFGWETVTELSEETKHAKRYIPLALVTATCLVAVLVIAYAAASIGALGADQFGAMEAPLSAMASIFYGQQVGDAFAILVYLAIIGSVAGFVVATPRLVLSLAKDKLFPSQLAAVHPVNKTPHKAIVFQTIVACGLVVLASGSYETLLHLLLPLLLLLYGTVITTVVVLRRKHPDAEPYISAPGGSWGPIICAVLMTALVVLWAVTEPGAVLTLELLASFLFLGVPVYFLLIFYYNPSAIVQFRDLFARVSYWLEPVTLPSGVREGLLGLFEDLSGSRVLDYGCGTGALTMDLADAVGEDGFVYATELSEKRLSILQERLAEEGVENVRVVHDSHLVSRVHPGIEQVDYVFSVGTLSFLQDVEKVMGDISRVLPEHGKVCFVEHVNFFWFLPDPAWMTDVDRVKDVFRSAGLRVYVKREKGLFWNYLVVYGFKSDADVPFV